MTFIRVPGYGEAVAGLDWVELPGADSHGAEMRQFAHSVNAQWQFQWRLAGKATSSVAFLPKGLTKRAPVAAAALVQAAIPDEPTCITLIDLQALGDDGEPGAELQYWVFATVDGKPATRMDFVGNAQAVRTSILDFLSTLQERKGVPVYTDLGELLDNMPYHFDVRPFTLDILRHSLTKKDFSRARFDRYRPVSLKVMGFMVLGTVAALGYLLAQGEIEQTQRREAAQARQRDIERNAAEMAQAIDAGINAAPPATAALPAIIGALQDLPLQISGWRLQEIDCKVGACTLTFKGQPLATWRGYMLAKPPSWPAPVFAAEVTAVIQELPVELGAVSRRAAAQLPTREAVRYAMGNLAQVIAPVGLQLGLQTSWERVAAQGQQQDGLSIPMRSSFTVSGPAVLMGDMATKLPVAAGITSVQIKLDEKTTFELRGEAYARP
ncbi:type 4b pilus protein PilO2 [Alicycliphilus denitrificans]|uniref:type 4b pilus protein PilO2 n=1 Tax=Alicycliphilus denitrificans TaxID=179636 RepID=UPI00384D227D